MNAFEKLRSLGSLVGGTPLLELHCRVRGREYSIYAKLETVNPTGSIKDRMALHILQDAYTRGAIEPGWSIVEATSGNTGIAFSFLGRALGNPVRIYMPDWMSEERRLLIAALGAEVISVSSEEGGFRGSVRAAERYAEEHETTFLPRQFENEANIAAHERTTGPEIIAQLAAIQRKPTAFLAGVGTGGTVMGVGNCFHEAFPDAAVHPLEPANSPTLRVGYRVGHHRVQGISDEFVPSILHLRDLDPIIDVWDGDAILMAQQLANQLGLGVGISSGANLLGALQIALEQGPRSTVVTVFADSNKKYLSTDLFGEEECRDHYLSREVELIDFRVIPPVRAESTLVAF